MSRLNWLYLPVICVAIGTATLNAQTSGSPSHTVVLSDGGPVHFDDSPTRFADPSANRHQSTSSSNSAWRPGTTANSTNAKQSSRKGESLMQDLQEVRSLLVSREASTAAATSTNPLRKDDVALAVATTDSNTPESSQVNSAEARSQQPNEGLLSRTVARVQHLESTADEVIRTQSQPIAPIGNQGSPLPSSTFSGPPPIDVAAPSAGAPGMADPDVYLKNNLGRPSTVTQNPSRTMTPMTPQAGSALGLPATTGQSSWSPALMGPASPGSYGSGSCGSGRCRLGRGQHCPVCLDGRCRAICGCDPCRPRFWARAEFMMAWLDDYDIPSLLTTSPSGTAPGDIGVLGAPGTDVLYGGDVGGDIRFGGRVTAGWWFDDCRKFGLQTEFFALGNSSGDNRRFASDSSMLLARPFFNTELGRQDSQVLAAPDLASGTIRFDNSSHIYSAAPSFRYNACCCSGSPCDCRSIHKRTDFLLGYRYFQLNEKFEAREVLTPTEGLYPAGTRFELTDIIETENEFHGVEFGADWTWQRDRWTWGLATICALGQVERRVTLDGSTRIVSIGLLDETRPGGFLIRPESDRRIVDRDFAAIPQIRTNIGYCIHRDVRLTAGYTMTYLSSAFRPGQFMNTSFAGSSLGDTPTIGVDSDVTKPHRDGVFLHGITLGLTYNF